MKALRDNPAPKYRVLQRMSLSASHVHDSQHQVLTNIWTLALKHFGSCPCCIPAKALTPHPESCSDLAGPCLCSSPRQTLLSSHLSSGSEPCWVMTLFTLRRYNSAPSSSPCHDPGWVLHLFKAPTNIAESASDSHTSFRT